LQNSRRGLFVGCSRYPDCDFTRPWGGLADGPMNLGKDPSSGLDVLLMRGPYGYYVQLGPTGPKAEAKPKRAAWPKNAPVATAELEVALRLLALPRQLGNHPQTDKPVEASIGPFGPYVKHDGAYKSIPKSDSVHDIALDRAVELLAAPKTGRAAAGKPLGVHPADQKPVALLSGRYGPYVKHGKLNATVPQDYDPEKLTLEEALEILAEKQGKTAKGGNSKARTAKAGAGKAPKTAAVAAAPKTKRRSSKPAPASPATAARKTRGLAARGKPVARRKSA
jgi:DNA topoisomerase-1